MVAEAETTSWVIFLTSLKHYVLSWALQPSWVKYGFEFQCTLVRAGVSVHPNIANLRHNFPYLDINIMWRSPTKPKNTRCESENLTIPFLLFVSNLCGRSWRQVAAKHKRMLLCEINLCTIQQRPRTGCATHFCYIASTFKMDFSKRHVKTNVCCPKCAMDFFHGWNIAMVLVSFDMGCLESKQPAIKPFNPASRPQHATGHKKYVQVRVSRAYRL